MNYELAKRLKDAGFPESKDSALVGKSTLIDDWVSPNLSDLIEACMKEGDAFVLSFTPEAKWAAGILYKADGLGSTPEEAVAKLWLALNEKLKNH